MTFRFIVLFLVCFLLLSPVFTQRKKNIEKPLILLVQDNSESIILNKDSVFYKTEYPSRLKNLISSLSEDYIIHALSFSDRVTDSLPLTFDEKGSSISEVFEEINKRFAKRNVGAMIFASDGIITKGKYPLNLVQKFRFPVYSIPLGDTIEYPDSKIISIDHNKFAFKGNYFPIRVKLQALHLNTSTSKLELFKGNKLIESKNLQFTSDDDILDINFKVLAEKEGLERYTLKLNPKENEANINNNTNQFVIEILENKQKVLILADVPHPDAGAIKKALDSNENLDVEFSLLKDFKGKPEDFNLVVLIQLPSENQAASKIIEPIIENRIPVLFVLGKQSKLEAINNLKLGWSIRTKQKSYNEVQASLNNSFSLFRLEADAGTLADLRLPPLIAPFGQILLESENEVLFTQKIKNIETSDPLLTFIRNDDHKIGIVGGEGLWRWRLAEYQNSGQHQLVDEVINKSIQYLALRVKKERFALRVKKQFSETEDIRFFANIYDPSYEAITGPDVQLIIKNNEDKEFRYILNPGENTYSLNIGAFEEGKYSYSAQTEIDSKQYIKSGSFIVNKINTEAIQTVANHNLLRQISFFTGGKSFSLNQLNLLEDELHSNPEIKPVSRITEKKTSLINFRWLFFIVLFWISLEWLMRKLAGAY